MTAADTFLASLARPVLMGIVNVTPNSFSDGHRYLDPAAAVGHARQLVRDGAAMVDLGAEASSFFRPGVAPVAAGEQLERLLPVLEGLRADAATRRCGDAANAASPPRPLISIDTRSAAVARRCIAAGADMINDISAGMHDPEMLPAVAELGCPIVLMHISPTYPENPAVDEGRGIVGTVKTYLRQRINAALDAGIRQERILVDPGIGFGKTMADNTRLVLESFLLHGLDCPVVLGLSRKRFLEGLGDMDELLHARPDLARRLREQYGHLATHPRDLDSAILTAYAASAGVLIHRVHNVGLCAEALRLLESPPNAQNQEPKTQH